MQAATLARRVIPSEEPGPDTMTGQSYRLRCV